MDKLPLEIVNNILIIKHESDVKELKKQIQHLNFRKDELEQKVLNMLCYLEKHEVKYCEYCSVYGDDDEIIYYDDTCEYLCEYCIEFKEELKEFEEKNIANINESSNFNSVDNKR